MVNEQPLALRLAEDLKTVHGHGLALDAADELRRLYAINLELLGALKMGYAETMEYIKTNNLSGAENNSWLVLARAAIEKATGETE